MKNKNYPAKCDCARYADLGLCAAHILAVAFKEGNFQGVISNFKPNTVFQQWYSQQEKQVKSQTSRPEEEKSFQGLEGETKRDLVIL